MGTTVIAERSVGVDKVFRTWNHGTGEAAGRVSAAWVQDVTRAGVLLVSTYLWHSEGLSERNIRILGAIASILARHGGPWIIGGGFNIPPSGLLSGEGQDWLRRSNGVVRASGTLTSSVGHGNEIDYFIVDNRIVDQVVSVEPVLSLRKEPHTPVRLTIKAVVKDQLMRVVKRPSMFPKQRPIGCARKPVIS